MNGACFQVEVVAVIVQLRLSRENQIIDIYREEAEIGVGQEMSLLSGGP